MHESPLEIVAEILLQLSVLLIAAKLVGEAFERYLRLPSVLGELGTGILLSPFALGGLAIPGIGAFFALPAESIGVEGALPVDMSLFFIAQVGAVVLLFEAGLETNRELFVRYLRPATFVAAGGVIVPFAFGFFLTVAFGFASLESIEAMIPALFIGTAMTATSVGITARVLSGLRRLDSPEGVTILAAAVVDDVIGIIILAIVVGVAQEGTVTPSALGLIFAKAVGFWLGLTILGSLAAPWISRWILKFRSTGSWLGIGLGLSLAAAAIAERYFGLAMIIGSYSFGLAMSGTRLKEKIEEHVAHVSYFLAPLFFAVIGQQVDFTSLVSGDISIGTALTFAAVLSIAGIISKLAGSGIPALFFGFNRRGATRIGVGMMPRGEVALIVAGIGLSASVIDRAEFSFVIVMAVVTTIVAPILLGHAFKGGSGLRNKIKQNAA